MTLEEMNAIVQNELTHIPEGTDAQQALRAIYQNWRLNSLGKNPEGPRTRREVLQWSLGFLSGYFPGFGFEYDREFFNEGNAKDCP